MFPALSPSLLLALFQSASAPPSAPAGPAEAPAVPTDAAGITALLLEKKDDADPEMVLRLANLRTSEALDGLVRFYDAVGSRYMRRTALKGLARFDGVPAGEATALQKLTDVATLSTEPELRDLAVDELAGCNAGRPYLAAIVNSVADDYVRERALDRHVAGARPEDVEWYLGIYTSNASKPDSKDAKKDKRKERDKDKDEKSGGKEKDPEGPPPLYTAPLKELALEGLASSRSTAELVTATDSGLVLVRRRALEEMVARRAPEASACAERMLDSRRERPDVRLFAAKVLLEERGPKFAERLYKDVRRGAPLELAFGIADLLAEVNDPSLNSQVIRSLGEGQVHEQRFHLRIAAKLSDPRVDKGLLELAKEKNEAVAADALRAMGVRGNPSFVPRLQDVVRTSRSPALLCAAIESMNRIRGSDEAWRKELQALVNHDEDVVRNAAIAALGASGDASQVAVLVAALDHPRWTTRLAAARALEELRTVEGVGALCQRIPKEDGRMASDFADILWRLTAQPFRVDGTRWQKWWEGEGASFRFPTPEEFQKRQQERDLREDKQVSRSFRGVKVDSRFFGLRITSHHVAFVVDVSGSMAWRLGGERATEGPVRMEVARKEMLACLEALEAGTHFNIVPFSDRATPWKQKSVEATEESFAEAQEFVAQLGPLGGTNVHGGLQEAFADPEVDTIFFLSDGEPSFGDVVDPTGIREAVQAWNLNRGVVIHTVSIGERFPLLEWLAADSGGQYRTYP